jgi:hypothetical protein
MDVTGLLAAALAVAVFPGGLYLASAALASSRGTAPFRVEALTPPEVAGLVAITFAAALLPLPGAPSQLIPTTGGAPPNLLALLLLAGMVLGLATAPRWDVWRCAAVMAAVLPLLALAAEGSTLTATTVAGLQGGHLGIARMLAALALVLAGPAVAGAGALTGAGAIAASAAEAGGGAAAGTDAGGRSLPVAATVALCALLAVAIGLPASWSSVPGVVVAVLGLAVAAVVGLGLHPRLHPLARWAGGAALVPAVVAVIMALARG